MVLVTGGTGTIGGAIAGQLATRPDYEIVILARDRAKAQRQAQRVADRSGNPRVRYEIADLSRREDIHALVERWVGALHVLINNASATPRSRVESEEGLEMQFAVNILGYYRMIDGFGETLKKSAPSRVINVASYWAGGLDLADLQFERRRYDNGTAYRQSKQAERMLTVAFAEQMAQNGIAVNACHPGDARSALSESLGFGGSQTADEAAETPVWLATSNAGGASIGKYFEHLRQVPCRFAADRNSIEALFRYCQERA